MRCRAGGAADQVQFRVPTRRRAVERCVSTVNLNGAATSASRCAMISIEQQTVRPPRRHAEPGEPVNHSGDPFAPSPLSPWRRAVYLFIAAVSFAVAMLGVVLPGLPTTPFLLVTSAFLLRSWPSMHERMLRSRFVGGLLSDWRQHRGVRPHVKLRAVTFVVVAVTLSIVFGGLPVPASVAMAACAVAGILVILRLPTIR